MNTFFPHCRYARSQTLVFILASFFFFFIAFVPAVNLTANAGATNNADGSIWAGRNKVTCYQEDRACSFCEALQLIANITDMIAQLALVAAGGLIIYGGIRILLPPGDSQQNFANAKRMITDAIWGVIIVLTSWVIVNTVLHILSGDSNYIWSKIDCENIGNNINETP
jgi:hypothetical protein